MASNPAFNRISEDAQRGYAAFREPGQAPAAPSHYQQQGMGYGQPGAPVGQDRLEDLYAAPSAGPVDTGRLTMDDVIMKTAGLFALVIAFAAGGWVVAANNPAVGMMLWIGGMIGTLILGLVIAFKKTLSVPLIIGYAALEGLFVGAVSQFFNSIPKYEGIVGQAVLATLATFIGMFAAYKFGLIKVTDKFRRIMAMAIIGYAIFAVINFIYAMVTSTPFGIGGSGALGIGISIFAVGLASLSLALDFDQIDRAIASGAPQKYSWLMAHGLIVTVVWLYIEFLRLFARLRD